MKENKKMYETKYHKDTFIERFVKEVIKYK